LPGLGFFGENHFVGTSAQGDRMTFLITSPLWLSALVLLVLPTIIAITGTVLVRRSFSLDKLRTNNEVAGFKFAAVGVLYAVLLAFAVVVVWEKFDESENFVAEEAGAAATIYRLADGVGTDSGAALRKGLNGYINAAIDKDWPAMEQGRASPIVTEALSGLYKVALKFTPGNERDRVLLAEILHQLDLLTQARRARLVMAAGIVPGVLWMVLFGGAVLTVGFTLFFGTQNLRAQTLMTGMLTLLIFSGLLVIVEIDHPFAGTVRVMPEALTTVMEDLGK
jgi:hypothetical protein